MSVNDYIGIPWVQGGHSIEGADCWGLILLVSRDVFGIDLGIYEGAKHTGKELGDIINGETHSSSWIKTEELKDGYIVIMTVKGLNYPTHVGIIVDGQVLHSIDASANGSSSIHPIKVLERIFNKVEVYKHANYHISA